MCVAITKLSVTTDLEWKNSKQGTREFYWDLKHRIAETKCYNNAFYSNQINLGKYNYYQGAGTTQW